MYEFAANADSILVALLLIVWGVAGLLAGGLSTRRRTRALLVLIGVGTGVAAARGIDTGLLWSTGWVFAADRVLVALPLLAVPMVATFALAVPALRRIAGRPHTTDIAGRPQTMEGAAGAPVPFPVSVRVPFPVSVRVPVRTTAAAALLGAYMEYLSRPLPPYGADMAIYAGVLLVAAGASRARSPRPGGARRVLAVTALVATAVTGAGLYEMRTSRLPDRMSMMGHGDVDYGGGPGGSHHGRRAPGTPAAGVADLTGPRTGTPDRAFTLTAQETRIRLGSGAVIDAWTYNGQAPGPSLTVRKGDLVEVTLVNRLPREGVTIHWHGLDVPNAEDGVAGVTQDAVQPGGSHVYRFRADQVGTFWYHTHQRPLVGVRRGLFGSLVVLPPEGATGEDITVMAHNWERPDGPVAAFGTSDTLGRRPVKPGTPVRLRVVNTDRNAWSDVESRNLVLVGTRFRVAAIDGVDLDGPSELDGVRLSVAEGGRYDLTFVMPDRPVLLADLANPRAGLLLTPGSDGRMTAPPVPRDAPLFDPATYGTPAPVPFTRFDRDFTVVIDDGIGFYDGAVHFLPTINGHSFPDTPVQVVRRGDVVRMTFVNRSHQVHPMHLHGHHALVLSRNGRPAGGSPWWIDTLAVQPGETYEVGFLADNPGVWMDHCHDLGHAADGMVTHLTYEGVSTPYEIGRKTPNRPE
ncbi:multicopper oxidase family protein [Streptosporangium sp. NBC_01469]|uniref:multicopper oxidase family protein n=1 Tax=Streptosporangium sp. NBC_01469 TaxID=2903898 RepID=UPI002E287E47|nr:multicopper oxidase family protein [Streptosporangium sp. NBC_01469]